MPSERRDGPERKRDARDDTDGSDPAQWLGYVELRTQTRANDEVRNDEEICDVVGQAARSRERVAAPGQPAGT